MIIGSAGTGPFFCFFGSGSSLSPSTSSTVTALCPLRVVDPFWKDRNDGCFGGGLGDCDGESTELVSEDRFVGGDRCAGGRDLLLP